MDQISQPYFTLHNGQIMLVDGPQNELNKDKIHKFCLTSFLEDNDDEMSITSSTMSDDESMWSSDDEDEEDLDLVVPLHPNEKSLTANRSTFSLGDFFKNVPRVAHHTSVSTLSFSEQLTMARTKSMANMDLPPQLQQKSPSGQGIQCDCKQTSAQETLGPATAAQAMKPDEYLAELLNTEIDTVAYDGLQDYFLKPAPEHIAAWDADLLGAIRSQDLDGLMRMHQSGKAMQARNQFGESILHVCVRRGTPEILKYLLEEGGVSPMVCCDYGRTPLHDAAWVASNPRSFEMMELLLERCPEMLRITDRRGFTPLNYVSKERWSDCCEFLEKHQELLQRLKSQN